MMMQPNLVTMFSVKHDLLVYGCSGEPMILCYGCSLIWMVFGDTQMHDIWLFVPHQPLVFLGTSTTLSFEDQQLVMPAIINHVGSKLLPAPSHLSLLPRHSTKIYELPQQKVEFLV